MKNTLLLTLSILLISCSNNERIVSFTGQSPIRGLATIVQLSEGESQVLLQDYFADVSAIDSVTAPMYFAIKHDKDGNSLIINYSDSIPRLSVLEVWIDGVPYSLVMRRSRKLPVEIAFVPNGKQHETVHITGHMNNWSPTATPLDWDGKQWGTTLWLNPGSYQYQLVVDGEWILDPANPLVEDNNIGGMNSVLKVGEIDPTKLPRIFAYGSESNGISIGFENDVQKLIVLWENHRLGADLVKMSGNGATITIPANARDFARSHLRVLALNAVGESNDLLIPLSSGRVVRSTSELNRSDLHAQLMYSLMIDRFMNADPTNDFPVNNPEIHPKANYHGGDILGITQRIKDGYFESIGVNTIWVSPITQNPLGAYGLYPEPRTKFSGYHGYWPISSSEVDFRYGTSDQVHQMLADAHGRGINVILDYVANHVHQEHPLYQRHPDWATPLYLPDGTLNTQKWDEHRLTTWFDTFLPTLDLERTEIYQTMTDSALYWVTEYAFDGFRHDATKHIPEVFWRTLTRKINEQVPAHRTIFQIGETYGSHELISSYISTGMLNSQFDFNVHHAATSAFARPDFPFANLNDRLVEGFGYYGWNNLMGIITGNHDKPRFISLAGGDLSFGEDTKLAGWTRTIGVGNPIGYRKLQMLLAFNLTIPGVPTIYQGDEFGQPGGDDPDNRRMMQFHNLEPLEEETLRITKRLASLRRGQMALNYGTFEPLLVTDKYYAYARAYFGQLVVVVFNKSDSDTELTINLPNRFSGIDLSAHFNSTFSKSSDSFSIRMPAQSFEVFTGKL